MRMQIPANARVPLRPLTLVPVPEDPEAFDLIGFISLLLVEHGRDLGLSGAQLEEIHSDTLGLLGGDILAPLNPKLAAQVVTKLRQRA